jgi:diguanylate cyclase (GGDEF)-like protein
MAKAMRPELSNEHRLRAVMRTGLCNPRPHRPLDRLAALAAQVLDAPTALVTLLGAEEQVLKGCVGLPAPWMSERTVVAGRLPCTRMLSDPRPVVVADGQAGPLLGSRSYAGVPLVSGDGHVLGSFCVLDDRTRRWTDEEIDMLSSLAASAASEIELAGALRSAELAHDREAARRRALERIAADAPLAESLAFVVGLVEEQAVGLSGVITLFEDGRQCGGSRVQRQGAPAEHQLVTFSPIRASGGGALGTLCLFGPEERQPTVEEAELIDEAAALATIAIERNRRSRELSHSATHDTLTGLPNRTLLQDRLEHALLGAKRRGTNLAAIFVDLDDFKAVNDRFGHAVGDEVLVEAGSRIARAVRRNDTAARYGGDEFVVLCEDVGSPAQAEEIRRRIADAFLVPFVIAGEKHSVRASAGLTVTDGSADAQELIEAADQAMYAEKESGRAGRRGHLSAVS